MKWILNFVLGPIFGAFGDIILSILHDQHERKLQKLSDKSEADDAYLGHLKAAIEAKRAVDADIRSRGLRAPDPNSRD